MTKVGKILPNLYTTVIKVLVVIAFLSLKLLLDDNMGMVNEIDVLPLAKQYADPSWIPGDWYLNQPPGYRLLFETLSGKLIVGWGFLGTSLLGRLVCYGLVASGLVLIGQKQCRYAYKFHSRRFEVFSPYWNSTTCIRSDNIDAIKQEITHLLEQEGCRRLTQLPQLEGSLEQLQAVHPWEQSCNPWIISLFAGKSGWTIVKTSPSELLCQRAEGARCPRLSVIAMQLGCDAFQLGVYWAQVGILLEADTAGQIFVSGIFGPDRPTEQFYEEQINLPGSLKQFSLLKVPELMEAAMRVNQDPELQRRRDEVDKLLVENADSNLLPAQMDEFFQGYTERIDQALAKVIANSKSWYWPYLIYDIYAHPEQLAASEAHLLYFRPPITHKPGKAYTLSPSQLEALLGTAEEDETAYNDPPYAYLDSGTEVYGDDVPW